MPRREWTAKVTASDLTHSMIQTLSDYYRIPANSFGGMLPIVTPVLEEAGFFQFGASNICYGRCHSGVAADVAGSAEFDASKNVLFGSTTLHMPFDFNEIVGNIRLERYRQKLSSGKEKFAASESVRKLYYSIRELLPTSFRRHLQRAYFSDWKQLPFPAWPVDFTVDNLHEEYLRLLMKASGVTKVPFIWFWPGGAPNCLIMTHDVETSVGRDFTPKLMDVDDAYGFKSSFQVIPEKRYPVSDEYVREIKSRGFELNIHDLNHDGNLYQDRAEFLRRAARINGYFKKYDSRGFRAGAMYRNEDWYDAFECSYDMSIPNVAHLEPSRGGCCTVMPYFIGNIVELPLTAVQDYSLFHILNDYSLDLWKQQIDLINRRNGLLSFITHPDYLTERRERNVYESLLDYLRQMIEREKIWAVLPGEVDRWWRARSQMQLVPRGNKWEILGPGKERARLAYAVLDGDQLVYQLEGGS